MKLKEKKAAEAKRASDEPEAKKAAEAKRASDEAEAKKAAEASSATLLASASSSAPAAPESSSASAPAPSVFAFSCKLTIGNGRDASKDSKEAPVALNPRLQNIGKEKLLHLLHKIHHGEKLNAGDESTKENFLKLLAGSPDGRSRAKSQIDQIAHMIGENTTDFYSAKAARILNNAMDFPSTTTKIRSAHPIVSSHQTRVAG